MRIITCPVFAWLLDDDYNMASRSLLHCFCRARDWIILAAQETEWFCDFKDNFFFQIYKIHYAVNLLITLAVAVVCEGRRHLLFYFVVLLDLWVVGINRRRSAKINV